MTSATPILRFKFPHAPGHPRALHAWQQFLIPVTTLRKRAAASAESIRPALASLSSRRRFSFQFSLLVISSGTTQANPLHHSVCRDHDAATLSMFHGASPVHCLGRPPLMLMPLLLACFAGCCAASGLCALQMRERQCSGTHLSNCYTRHGLESLWLLAC
ncbi:hypothetical protein HDK77DRAFT_311294 [Phyllosticta capitalensis]